MGTLAHAASPERAPFAAADATLALDDAVLEARDLAWLPARWRVGQRLAMVVIAVSIAGLAATALTGAEPEGERTWVLVLAALVGGGLGVWASAAVTRRLAPRTLPERIARVEAVAALPLESDVRVRGRVRLLKSVPSLVTGEPAALRRVRIDVEGCKVLLYAGQDFDLVHDDGRALRVRVAGARLLSRAGAPWTTIDRDRFGALVRRVPDDVAAPRPGSVFTYGTLGPEQMRARKSSAIARQPPHVAEWIVRAGDVVEVAGIVDSCDDPSPDERIPPREPLTVALRSSAGRPLIVLPV